MSTAALFASGNLKLGIFAKKSAHDLSNADQKNFRFPLPNLSLTRIFGSYINFLLRSMNFKNKKTLNELSVVGSNVNLRD